MEMHWFVLLVLAVLCVFACHVHAGEQKLVLKEHLNKQWTGELVAFPFSAGPGERHLKSVRLAGPDGWRRQARQRAFFHDHTVSQKVFAIRRYSFRSAS